MKKFVNPEVEIKMFAVEDVLTTSGQTGEMTMADYGLGEDCGPAM